MDSIAKSPDYEHQPLRKCSSSGGDGDSSTVEIRLVHLLPLETGFADPIRLRLVHALLPLPRPSPASSLATKQKYARLFEALDHKFPMPWRLQETTEGELITFNTATGETHLLDDGRAGPTFHLEELYDSIRPKYEALSYIWGDTCISEFATVEVEVNNRTTVVRKLGLRRNLASALRHLRLLSSEGEERNGIRVLWIDAICINQDDVDERNQQVERMTDIYTLAHRVVAWLGDEDEDSGRAVKILSHVGKQLRYTTSGRIIAAPGATEPRLWRDDTPPAFTERDWRAVMTFVERPWFYRIWCWQEIKLGSRAAILQCGRDTIDWKPFYLAIRCLHNKDTTPSRHFRERCRHIAFLETEGQSLGNLLDTAKSKGCSDPRDKIFGLLGITPAYLRAGVTVDYRRSPEHVYKEAFLAHLHATLRLDLLKHCNISTRRIGGPSWVPDWSRTEFAAPILSEQLAAGHSRAWFTYRDEDPETLGVVGTIFTTIKRVSTTVASRVEDETLLSVKDWYRQFHSEMADASYCTGCEDMEPVFVLTLCMNRTRERHLNSHMLSANEWVALLHRLLRLDPDNPDSSLFLQREIANTIQKIRGRRFFVTKSGHFGTALAGAQVGRYSDVVNLNIRATRVGLTKQFTAAQAISSPSS